MNRPPYSRLRSWASYDGALRQAILRLKYEGDVGLGEALAFPLAGYLRDLAWPIELVCPTPVGRSRLKQRGYNQVALISLPLALSAQLPHIPRALCKARDTASQVGLNHDQRFANVAEAFSADRRFVEGKSVLVVDDVTTSGATILDCTRALLQAGAREVFALTLGRAGLGQHSIEENGRVA
jgi:ComF family protein